MGQRGSRQLMPIKKFTTFTFRNVITAMESPARGTAPCTLRRLPRLKKTTWALLVYILGCLHDNHFRGGMEVVRDGWVTRMLQRRLIELQRVTNHNRGDHPDVLIIEEVALTGNWLGCLCVHKLSKVMVGNFNCTVVFRRWSCCALFALCRA